ncbi:hypothetical protein H0H81_004385 [Sphagnurus paluster]|uniref:DUF4139 domain-containing protein n=1 Tax=Sphagnurus paluster TaxID=117069 RepID=A0A9P7KJG0_9AGAR|nr:hypothetical protein H0H81_004385 [Sphagnurus paluster]
MAPVPCIQVNAQDHPIKSVTIFKAGKAEVVRHFPLNLEAGLTRVEIRGLPSTFDTQSVRITGLGNAHLHDVVCTVGATLKESEASETVRALRAKRLLLDGGRRVREDESHLLVTYAKTIGSATVQPYDMTDFLCRFVKMGEKNLAAIEDINEAIVKVEREIKVETEKSGKKKGDTRGQVDIVFSAEQPLTVNLKVTYMVGYVYWTPTYELHATIENGKPSPAVALHYRARVIQSTGEDWTGTALKLSTISSDATAKAIPQLHPVKLEPKSLYSNAPQKSNAFSSNAARVPNQPLAPLISVNPNPATTRPLQRHQQVGSIFGAGLFGAGPGPAGTGTSAAPSGTATRVTGGLFGLALSAPGTSQASTEPTSTSSTEESYEQVTVMEVPEPTAFVHETPAAVSFSVVGETSVRSDGVEHQVLVGVLPLEAAVSYVAIPRIEPSVYLQCEVKNTSDYRLPAGPVSVILDDSFVSKTSIEDLNPGDNFNCTLGTDAATKLTTVITVSNRHTFALPELVVRDAVPTCDHRGVRVLLRKPAGLADAEKGEEVELGGGAGVLKWGKVVDGKGGEKEGKFEWRVGVQAKDRVVLEAEWEAEAPADVRLEERIQAPSA